MYQRILVATDGRDGTRRAVAHAITIAERFDATLHALSVRVEGPYDSPEAAQRAAEEAISSVETKVGETGVDVHTAIREGTPHEEILAYAESADVDMIVVGTRGRSGLDRVIVGSVAEQVLRNADAPVVTVRTGE